MAPKAKSTEGSNEAPRSKQRGAVSVPGDIEPEWESIGDEKPKRGRPTIYNEELAALICALLAEGQSLRKICSLPEMPHLSTVMFWLFKPSDFKDSFLEQYRNARQMQAEILADELVDIADDSTEDEIYTDDGKRMLNKEFVARSKLRVETRQWVAVRLLSKVYGPKAEQAEPPKSQRSIRIIKAEDMARG